MTTQDVEQTPIAWQDLPTVITTYLAAHQARDVDAAIAAFTPAAEVTDEGETHRGHREIEHWLRKTGSQYTYTTEFTGSAKTGDAGYDITAHLEGDFPGGVADLHYRIEIDGALIARMVIEP